MNPQAQVNADDISPDGGDEVINQPEFENDLSEDDEGGMLENSEMDDEEPVIPIPANSVHTPDDQPPTALGDLDDRPPTGDLDAQADHEGPSSSAGTSITISTTGPRITTPSSNQNVYIEKFPSSFAGMPVATAGSEPVYLRYASQLGTSSNPWAPFKSSLDWEIARWAKLRGPGSTAVTDLLKIDGVRFFNHIFLISLTIQPYSYRKHLDCHTKIHKS